MLERIKDRYNKRAVILVLALLSTLLLLLLYLLVDNKASLSGTAFDFSQNLINSLLTTIMTGLFMGLLYFMLVPKERMLTQIEEIDPQTTIEYFDQALRDTTSWNYHGHIGRWVRNIAIPAIAKHSRERGETASVCLLLINPANEELCRKFHAYRSSIRFKEPGLNTDTWAQVEIWTTILRCLQYHQDPAFASVRIEVYLMDFFVALRKDMSDNAIFLTRVDPRAPALLLRRPDNSRPIETMFTALRNEFEHIKKQSRRIAFDSTLPVMLGRPSEQLIIAAMSSLHLGPYTSSNYSVVAKEVVNRLESEYHPYN